MGSGCNDRFTSINADVEDVRLVVENVVMASLPNSVNIKSTHIGKFKHHKLLAKARARHLSPDVKNKILLSLGKNVTAD